MAILNSGTAISNSSTIDTEHFGLNYLFHIDAGAVEPSVFANIASDLHGASSVRFPGGTVAEIGTEGGVSPLDISVINGEPAASTVAFLRSADANGWSTTFVLPMWRFVDVGTMTVDSNGTGEIAAYVAAVIAMADELGVTIDGFELGNEWDLLNSDHLGAGETLTDEMAAAFSTLYAEFSADLAVAVHQEIDDANLADDPFIAIQSLWGWMHTAADRPNDYLNALEVAFPDSSEPNAAQNVIDTVIGHFYLSQPGGGAEINDPASRLHFRNIENINAIFGNDLDYLISEWNVQGTVDGTTIPIDENSADGIQQLEPVVGIFHTIISEGVEHANFWAVRNNSWNSLYGTEIENDMPEHDRPVRYLFDLLSDQLVGTQAIDLNGNSAGSMGVIGNNIHVYGFAGTNSTVLYLGSRSDTAQNISLDLGNYGTFSENPLIHVTSITVNDPNLASWQQETTILTQEYTFNQFQALSGGWEFSPYALLSIEIIYSVEPGEVERGTPIQDAMFGTATNDIFTGSLGADEIFGYFGTDTVTYSASSVAVNVYLNTYYGANSGGYADGDILQSIENVTGSAFDDTISGDTGANVLNGNAGNDTLLGRYGNDTIYGGTGNDSIDGGVGNDTLRGEAGDDILIGGTSTSDLRDLIYGGTGNDSIDGGYGNDALRGEAGDDTIIGGFGTDTLMGGTGNDVLSGSALGDSLFGGDGIDFLNGGWGHDRVNGGAGADRFFHLGIADHGTDWVQDYDATEGDTLLFGNASANGGNFQVNLGHATSPTGERSGDDNVEEAFVIYRPTGQIMWVLIDGGGQGSINIVIDGTTYDLLG